MMRRPNQQEAVEAAQRSVFEAALELARLDRQLAQICRQLPLPADVDDLFEDRLPSTPAVHLYGVLGAVKVELQQAIRTLLEAAQIDEVMLRRAFRQLEAKR